MRLREFAITEAVNIQQLRKGQEDVKIGFEFEILIPADSVTAGGPQYDPNDSSWIDGKTVEDMITKATQNNLSGWRDPVTDNFRIKPTKKAQVGGTGVIWDAYTAWGTKQVADANENLEQRSKDVLDAVRTAFDKLKLLVTEHDYSASEIRRIINKFKQNCKQGGDDVDLTRIFARREPTTLTLEQIKKIKWVAHHSWIHTSGPIDEIWYKIKLADDYNSRYFGGMSSSAPLASTNFVRWIRETFGTTEIKELLKNWWTLRTSTTRPKEAVLRKIWFWVTPDAIETTNSGGSYTTEMTGWLKSKLEPLFGTVEVFRRYHESSKKLDRWYIEPDGSLQPNRGDYAAEVVGPPLSYRDAVEALKKFVGFCKDNNIYTNSSTGLHINVSVPNKLDVLKLALFSGDKYALKTFGREQSRYARSIIDALRGDSSVTSNLESEITDKTISDVLNTARSIASDHFSSVNLTPSGYISFRQAGGDYLNKMDSVLIVLRNFARAMVIASHPDMAKEEYLNKLMKLLPDKSYTGPHLGSTIPNRGIPIFNFNLVILNPSIERRFVSSGIYATHVMDELNNANTDLDFIVDSSWKQQFIAVGGLRSSTVDEIENLPDDKFFDITVVPKTIEGVRLMHIKQVSGNSVFSIFPGGNRSIPRLGVARVSKDYISPGTPHYNRIANSIIRGRVVGPRGILPETM